MNITEDDSYTGPHQFEMDGWISCAPFEKLLHITIHSASDGNAVLSIPFLRDFAQGSGLMHGGALVGLADTAIVMAIKSLIPPDTHFATISANTEFLYPVKKGVVTAKAVVKDQNDRLLTGESLVFDQDNNMVLKLSAVFKIAKDAKIRGVTINK